MLKLKDMYMFSILPSKSLYIILWTYAGFPLSMRQSSTFIKVWFTGRNNAPNTSLPPLFTGPTTSPTADRATRGAAIALDDVLRNFLCDLLLNFLLVFSMATGAYARGRAGAWDSYIQKYIKIGNILLVAVFYHEWLGKRSILLL